MTSTIATATRITDRIGSSPEPSVRPNSDEEVRARRLRETPSLYRGQYARAMAGKASGRQAIKVMCYSCMGWEGAAGGGTLKNEVRRCTSPACPLFAYRPGGAKGLRDDTPKVSNPSKEVGSPAPDASEGEKATLVGQNDLDAGKTKSDGLSSSPDATDPTKLAAVSPARRAPTQASPA
jgi:hypothetical protein